MFKGVKDEFEGMDTELNDAETLELRRMAEKEIGEVAAETEGEPVTLSQTHSNSTCKDEQSAS